MRIGIVHDKDREEAKRRIEQLVASLASRYGGYVRELKQEWTGDTLHFEFTARGARARGTVEVTDSEAIVDGRLPLLARPFEGRIRSLIEREGARLFT
ncbi:MAG TPA: polyhydroxyalkanoic acid system family protein [Thermoanaerobaculia bacterium]